MNKILVLMSTYNGEKYVDLQVKSVLNQKQVSVKLYIRDDGSKDKTVDIIKSFKDDRITIFEGRNKGARDSFFELIESAPLDFDYYAFCDQDDYWEDDKLFCAVSKLEMVDSKRPSLYYSGQVITDSKLNVIAQHNLDTGRSFGANFIFNQMAGCTAVFNVELLKKLKMYFPHDIFGHDTWCFKLCAALEGNIIVESKGHILYRQHENNVVGLKNSFAGKLARSKEYIFSYKDSNYAQQILNAHENEISDSWKEFLKLICQVSQGSLKAKIGLMKSDLIDFNSVPLRALFIIKVILGTI